AIVNTALQGTQIHDLARFIAGQAKVSGALASRENDLKNLITNLNTTAGAFASEQGNLRASIHLLPGFLQRANSAFAALNASFPATRAFAREILPGVRETPATIAAAFPWIAQAKPLLSEPELRGLVGDLRPATHDLAEVSDQTIKLLPQADLLSKCFTQVILPT